ncbi:MAG: hypothetical protein CVT60_05755 [Actinobacteria bacterium HGW-Actinobacteria-10]|jgi:hypothetical protein|nr:MAG: hypothetical protein CVT60_05755 [Actinobacteria bacterium HGW-Actinobacteria-10]
MSGSTATLERIRAHTPPEINERIRRETVADVTLYSRASFKDIERRLAELDTEWTAERMLESNAAGLVLVSSLAALRNRRWLLLTGVLGWFLLQHAMRGWSLPLGLIRRMGFRTEHEVAAERAALLRLVARPQDAEEPLELLREAGWTT